MVSKSAKGKKSSPVNGVSSTNSVVAIASIVVILVALAIMITLAFQQSASSKDVTRSTIEYDYQVARQVGINVDNDSLHFGAGPRGASLKRSLNITPSHDGRVELSWSGDGNLSASDNGFEVQANTTVPVNFTISIAPNASLGNYSGTIFIDLYRE